MDKAPQKDGRRNLPDIEDFAALDEYLHQTGRIADETHARFRILSGGVSNRVVLVELSTGETWVIKQALEKLRVQLDWRCAPERSEREALALSLLAQLAPPGSITSLIVADRGNHLLAMRAVPEPRANWKELLLSGVIAPAHSKLRVSSRYDPPLRFRRLVPDSP